MDAALLRSQFFINNTTLASSPHRLFLTPLYPFQDILIIEAWVLWQILVTAAAGLFHLISEWKLSSSFFLPTPISLQFG